MNSRMFNRALCAGLLGLTFGPTWAAVPNPPGVDLEVTYINRTPMYERYQLDYVNGKPVLHAGTENERRWPTNGEIVTFTAHIANHGTMDSGPFILSWFMDGTEVASETRSNLAVAAETTATYQWPWAHQMDGERVLDDHTVRCTVDPANVLPETYEDNNTVEDYINAMALRFTITPAMAQTYAQPARTNFPFSAENWMQRQVAAMNANFARSIYPVAPGGATLRVRANVIEVSSVNPGERTNDGAWFVDADYRMVSGGYEASTDIDWSLVHELSHQVGLIDLYNYNVESDTVHVLDAEGDPANFSFSWPRADLMGGGDIAPYADGHFYSSFSARAVSSTAGYRRGYYGEFQYDIPEQNFLRVLDNQGHPAAGAQVALFQRQDGEIDNAPEIAGVTDTEGRWFLTNRSVGGAITTRTGHTLRDNPFGIVDVVGGRNTFLVKLSQGTHEEFAWLDLTAFNLAYWMGNTLSNEVTLVSHVPPPGAPAAPPSPSARIEGQRVTLCWSNVAGAAAYNVYAAYAPEYRYQRVSSLLSNTCFTVTAQTQNRVYAVTAVGADGRESGFSRLVWAPRLQNPASIAVASDGRRIVLDPQNGHALLEQRWDGRFIRNLGSVHYHLEYSKFLAIDGLDRLLISHPADFYSSRHSVRMASREAEALLEFGQRGSGPGQFETPAGVAAHGRAKTIEGPWPNDASTTLLLHFDGSYAGAAGESGTATRTSFVVGKYHRGVLITNLATLTYPTADNLPHDQGAAELWFKPNWDGTNTAARYLLGCGAAFNNGFQIIKDGANNLRFMLWRGSRESGVGTSVTSWRAGEWHHVGIAWVTNQITLYVDGQNRSSSTNVALPDAFATTLYVGSSPAGTQQADGVIDELRISDTPRIGNSDTADYTIFVADSGNHRLEAFTEAGVFRGAWGTLGSGSAQFNDPRGVAVDAAGHLLVADRNNNRIQVLSYDGTDFNALGAVTAGLNRPIGVCAYRDSHWIVADTGNNQIKVISTNGALLGTYSAPNDGYTGNFNQPQGVATDQNGNILVADTGNDRIVTLRGLLPTNAPPRFLREATRVLENGTFQTRIRAATGQRLVIQTSIDLSHWTDWTNLLMSASEADLTDSTAMTSGRRFYRALSP